MLVWKKLTACVHAINITKAPTQLRVKHFNSKTQAESVFHTITLPSGFLNEHLIIHRLGKQQWLEFCWDLCGRVLISDIFNNFCGYTEASRVPTVQKWTCFLLCWLQFHFQVWAEAAITSIEQWTLYSISPIRKGVSCLDQ